MTKSDDKKSLMICNNSLPLDLIDEVLLLCDICLERPIAAIAKISFPPPSVLDIWNPFWICLSWKFEKYRNKINIYTFCSKINKWSYKISGLLAKHILFKNWSLPLIHFEYIHHFIFKTPDVLPDLKKLM